MEIRLQQETGLSTVGQTWTTTCILGQRCEQWGPNLRLGLLWFFFQLFVVLVLVPTFAFHDHVDPRAATLQQSTLSHWVRPWPEERGRAPSLDDFGTCGRMCWT